MKLIIKICFILYLLINSKSGLSKIDGFNLLNAASSGSVDLVKSILDQNVDINFANDTMDTALHKAAYKNNLEVVNFLLEKNAKIIANKDGDTPIFVAIKDSKSIQVLALLINKFKKEQRQIVNKNGDTLFHIAAQKNISELIPFFYKNGLNINQANNNLETPLMTAVIKNNLLSVEEILKLSPDIYLKEKNGLTVFELAERNNNIAIIKALQKFKNSIPKETELMMAAYNGDVDRIKTLLSEKEIVQEIDAQTKNGNTALIIAVIQGNYFTTKLLLKHGAKKDTKNTKGLDAQTIAKVLGYTSIHDLFLDIGMR